LEVSAVLQVILLLLAVCVPIVQWKVGAALPLDNGLQELQAEKQRTIHALDLLNKHAGIVKMLTSNADTVDSISLSLIEAVKQRAESEFLALTQLTVTQLGGKEMATGTGNSATHALRVSFAVTLDRAVGILSLFDALRKAANWRPIEIRGCSVSRLPELVVKLHATCSVDVYYFPEIDK